MSKVLLIGLDGATFDIIHPLVAAGRLPNLARIMASGAQATLKSTVPPITPTAWTSVFTGKNPGKHGIFDFQSIDPATYARGPVHVDQHREKTLWDLLGQVGKRSIVVDVPFTYPPRPLNGLMLTGMARRARPKRFSLIHRIGARCCRSRCIQKFGLGCRATVLIAARR